MKIFFIIKASIKYINLIVKNRLQKRVIGSRGEVTLKVSIKKLMAFSWKLRLFGLLIKIGNLSIIICK